MKDNFVEIERKFLIASFPDGLPLKGRFEVCQAYLSTEPEVRIRRGAAADGDAAYFLTVKSGGGLARREVELRIQEEQFRALADMVPYPFIKKEFRVYALPGGLDLECSLVDGGLDTGFMYAEVEFPSVEAAERFTPCFGYVREITHCSGYKMKNYWKRTRAETCPAPAPEMFAMNQAAKRETL